MKSLKKMAELADRFESKIIRTAIEMGEDPKSVTADAFFNPKGDKDESRFQASILSEGSNFLAALPPQVKKCSIGASVDVPGKTAGFLVSTQPPVPANTIAQIKEALNKDYTKFYGQAPAARVMARAGTGEIKPPTLRISHPEIIAIT